MVNFRPLGNSSLTPVVKNLLIINGLCYLACLVFYYKFNIDLNDRMGLYFPVSGNFKPYQFITHFFFHSFPSLWHIGMNMLALWLFGSSLENYWGPVRFLTFYIVTALGAAMVLTFVNYLEYRSLTEFLAPEQIERVVYEGRGLLLRRMNYTDPSLAKLNQFLNTPTVGASGAVYGVLLGFGMLFPNTILLFSFIFPVKAKWLVIFYGATELFYGLSNNPDDNVAHFAHLGGMLFGFILIKYWNKTNRNSLY